MEKGLVLTALGMSWVFIFLSLLILFSVVSSKIIIIFFSKHDNPEINNSTA
jgi:Na+-transporting methylmalonyl-CoA/oxaloacetate decarboxylase gamma subunit